MSLNAIRITRMGFYFLITLWNTLLCLSDHKILSFKALSMASINNNSTEPLYFDFSDSDSTAVSSELLLSRILSTENQFSTETLGNSSPGFFQPDHTTHSAYDSKILSSGNEECENLARDYAAAQNLCDVPSQGSFSCRDRCGEAPTFGKPMSGCGCDGLCMLHKYCCHDIAIECPTIYAKSLEFWRHEVENGLARSCSLGFQQFVVFISVERETETMSGHEFSSVSTTELSFTTQNNTGRVSLENFINDFTFFYVADLTSGIILKDFLEFSRFREAPLRPHFIPVVTSLKCPDITPGNILSVFELLEFCLVQKMRTMTTSLHRDCILFNEIYCGCQGGHFLRKFLLDVCINANHSLTVQVDDGWGQMFTRKNWETLTRNNGGCAVHERTSAPDPVDDETELVLGPPIALIATPVLSNTRQPQLLSKGKGGFNEKSEQAIKDLSGNTDVTSEDNFSDFYDRIQLVVELTHSIEKRLVCAGRRIPLSECRLAECAPGAFLSLSPQAKWKFAGRSCVLPRRVVVEPLMSVCMCMRATRALSSLHLWHVRAVDILGGLCSVEVLGLSTGKCAKSRR